MLQQIRRSFQSWARPHRQSARSGDWTKCTLGNAVRLRDGCWADSGSGQLWRRWSGSHWEYEQDSCPDHKDDLLELESDWR